VLELLTVERVVCSLHSQPPINLDIARHQPYDIAAQLAELANGIPVGDFLTPPEIAKLLKVSTDMVRRLIDSAGI
jgi:hypothetical protein